MNTLLANRRLRLCIVRATAFWRRARYRAREALDAPQEMERPSSWRQVDRWFFWEDGQTVALIEFLPDLRAHPWRWAAWPGTGGDRCDYTDSFEQARAAAEAVLRQGENDGREHHQS